MRRVQGHPKHLYGIRRPIGIRRAKGTRLPSKLDVKIDGTEEPLLQLIKRNYLVALYNGYAQLLATFRGAKYNKGRPFGLFFAVRQIREKQKFLKKELEQHQEFTNHQVTIQIFISRL